MSGRPGQAGTSSKRLSSAQGGNTIRRQTNASIDTDHALGDVCLLPSIHRTAVHGSLTSDRFPFVREICRHAVAQQGCLQVQSSRDKHHSLRTEYDHLVGTNKLECIAVPVRRCWVLNCHGCNGLQRPRRPSLWTTSALGPTAASRARTSIGSNRCSSAIRLLPFKLGVKRSRLVTNDRHTQSSQQGCKQKHGQYKRLLRSKHGSSNKCTFFSHGQQPRYQHCPHQSHRNALYKRDTWQVTQ